tara:strand:- start:134519 stop:135103 length:585 start_codon:yes stop_codon:yes gene_type:complete
MGGPKRVARSLETWDSKRWPAEVDALRRVLLDCELEESVKWNKLCYSKDGRNIGIIQEMKSVLAFMFFKGALLSDAKGLLKKPGENSNSGRRFEFTAPHEITELDASIRSYVEEAIAIAKAGLKVGKAVTVVPDEVLAKFAADPAFKSAFETLTPGRQRGYNLYFGGAKSAEARERRIEKYSAKILSGKGFHDR